MPHVGRRPTESFLELCNQQAYALREVQARGGTLAEAQAQLPPPYAATPPSYALSPYKAPQYAASPEYASPAHQSPLRAPAAPSTAYPSRALAATPAPSYNFWERDPNRDEWGNEILSSNPFEYEEPRGESSSSHNQHRQHSLAKGPAVTDRAARRYGFRSGRDRRAAQGW
ncbi:hypothetical protein JCM6882_001584 [Rhodosporidiobolus microsporus]